MGRASSTSQPSVNRVVQVVYFHNFFLRGITNIVLSSKMESSLRRSCSSLVQLEYWMRLDGCVIEMGSSNVRVCDRDGRSW